MAIYTGASVYVAWSMLQSDAKVFRNRLFRGTQLTAPALADFRAAVEGGAQGLFCGALLNLMNGRYLLDDETLSTIPVTTGYRANNQFTGQISAGVAGETQFNRVSHAIQTFSFNGLKNATTEGQVREFLIAHAKLKNAENAIVSPAAEGVSFGVTGRNKF